MEGIPAGTLEAPSIDEVLCSIAWSLLFPMCLSICPLLFVGRRTSGRQEGRWDSNESKSAPEDRTGDRSVLVALSEERVSKMDEWINLCGVLCQPESATCKQPPGATDSK